MKPICVVVSMWLGTRRTTEAGWKGKNIWVSQPQFFSWAKSESLGIPLCGCRFSLWEPMASAWWCWWEKKKPHRLWIQHTWNSVIALLLTSCVTLGKLPNLSEHPLSSLSNRGISSPSCKAPIKKIHSPSGLWACLVVQIENRPALQET